MNIKDIKDIVDDVKELTKEAKDGLHNMQMETDEMTFANAIIGSGNHQKEDGDSPQFPKEKQKRTIFVLVAIVLLLLTLIFVFLINPSNSKKRQKGVAITTNVVSEINKISEFTTAAFYKEIVLQDAKYKYKQHKVYQQSDNRYKRAFGMDKKVVGVETDSTEIGRIVIIAKGRIRAGFNFSRLRAEDLVVKNDTLMVAMPQAEVFDIIINPSDIEFFDRKGDYWDEDDIKEIIQNGKVAMYEQAMNENILEKANQYGVERMASIFKAFGFKEVLVSIKEPVISIPSVEKTE